MENINLADLKPIKSKGVDLAQFDGKSARIASVEADIVPSKFAPSGEAEVLRVKSEAVTTLTNRDGETIPIYASELFALNRDDDGSLGWPENGKLAHLLKLVNKTRIDQLNGASIRIRVQKKRSGPDNLERESLGLDLR